MDSQLRGKSTPHVRRTLSWWLIGSVLLLAALWAGPQAWAAELGSCGQASVPGPCARDDGAVSEDGEPVTINVLANDRDRSHTGLRVTAVTDPRHGKAKINADSTVTYTPDHRYHGVDIFSYTVKDGLDIAAYAKVIVKVEAEHNHRKGRCHVRPIDRDEDRHEPFFHVQTLPGGAAVPVITTFHLPLDALPFTLEPTETLSILFTPMITPTGNVDQPPDSPPGQGANAGLFGYVWTNLSFELDMLRDDQSLLGLQLEKPLEVTITYPDELVAGLDESTLIPYYWTANGWSQAGITLVSRDPGNNTIVFLVDGIVGEISLFARPPLLFMPVLRGK